MPNSLQEVHAAYLANADYDLVDSVADGVTKAKAFVVAVRRLISFAQSSANQSSSMSFDMRLLTDERKRAEAFIAVNDTGNVSSGGMNCFSFEGYGR